MAQMRKPGAAVLVTAAVIAVTPISVRAEVIRPGDQGGALGLTPGKIPEILKKAKADPYAAPAAPGCETIPTEIAALDQVLGPDADAPVKKEKTSDQAGSFIVGALKDQIPYRGVVRFITGASHADKVRTQAVMAGWTRRGYLKGMEVNLGCAERESHAPVPTITPGDVEVDPAQTAAGPARVAPSTEEAAETAAAHASAAPVAQAAAPPRPPVQQGAVQQAPAPAQPMAAQQIAIRTVGPPAGPPKAYSAFGSRVLTADQAPWPR